MACLSRMFAASGSGISSRVVSLGIPSFCRRHPFKTAPEMLIEKYGITVSHFLQEKSGATVSHFSFMDFHFVLT